MNPLAAFGGAMSFALSSNTSSDGKQGGASFQVGDFNAGFKLSKQTTYLIGGLAFLAVFAYIAKR